MKNKFGLLRTPGFAWLWGGQTFSTFGSQIGSLALAFIAVKELNAGPQEMGVLSAAGTASFLLVGLVAGAWVDRWIKRRVMIIADVIRMICVGLIPALYFANALNVWVVIAIAFVMGLATVFFDVAYQSFVPVILPSDKIAAGNSALETTNQTAGIAGPGIVGFLIDLFKAPTLLVIDAVSYLVSALTLGMIKDTETPKPKEDRKPLHVEIREGLRFVVRQPLIRRISLTTSVNNLFTSLMFSIFALVFLGSQYLNFGAAAFGLLGTSAAIGSLLGALATTKLIKWIGEGTLISVSAILSGCITLLVPIAVTMHNSLTLPLLLVMDFLNGFAVLAYNITQVSARQRLCPPELLGRMNASIRFFVWGVMPIGGLLGGAIAEGYGVNTALWVGAIGSIFSSVFVVFSPLTGMRKLPDGPEAH
ncbi:MAG: MFS transporter [Rhodoluna sp.]|nr:MFS transporter [Rhodoluna sp.]